MPLQGTLGDCRVELWHTTSLSPAVKWFPDPYAGRRQALQYLREWDFRVKHAVIVWSFGAENMVVR